LVGKKSNAIVECIKAKPFSNITQIKSLRDKNYSVAILRLLPAGFDFIVFFTQRSNTGMVVNRSVIKLIPTNGFTRK
jgi:hypothetical protein